jgi:hypothetical protein
MPPTTHAEMETVIKKSVGFEPTVTATPRQGPPPPPRPKPTPYPKATEDDSTPTSVPDATSQWQKAGATHTPHDTMTTSSLPDLSNNSDSSSSKRGFLRNMWEFAETPLKDQLQSPVGVANGQPPMPSVPEPAASTAHAPSFRAQSASKSPELRLTTELATTLKEKAAALHQVAELQDEVTQSKLWNGAKVGFHSPPNVGGVGAGLGSTLLSSPGLGCDSTPRRRRQVTPFPKVRHILSSPEAANATRDDIRPFLIEAVEQTAHEYDTAELPITFLVRRPYGAALSKEQDWWCKAGQLNAKRYAAASNVFHPETLEVAALIEADQSIFVLYGKSNVRHQTATGFVAEYGPMDDNATLILGNISYIDKDANEMEYSLEELYDTAVQVRSHYASRVDSFAAALKWKGLSPSKQSSIGDHPVSKMSANTTTLETSTPRTETADKAVGTEAVALEQTETTASKDQTASAPSKKKASAPVEDDSTTDVLASFFSMIFRTIWFVCIALPFRILTTALVLAVSVALVAFLWLYWADDHGAGAMGASMHVYTNQPGIL